MIPRRGRKSKIFLSVVIYVVKADFIPLSAIVESPANAGVTRLCGVCPSRAWIGSTHSQTRRDTNFAIPGYSISAIIPRRGRKSKIFLSVVIHVVKVAFVSLPATERNPANAGVARFCGVSLCPVPDTATALPNQARYQLRYTRIFSFCHYTTARGEKQSFFSLRSFMCAIHIGQVKKSYEGYGLM